MSIYKRGNNYWVSFRFNRVRYRKRSPHNSIAGAKSYEAALRNRLAQGKPAIEKPKENKENISFVDFFTKWLETYVKTNNKLSEYKSKQSILNAHLRPFWGKKSINKISALSIEEFKKKKLNSNLSAKTINNILTVLSTCLRAAKDWGYIKEIPMIKKLKAPKSGFDYLTVEESKQLLNYAEGLWYRMIFTALKTGVRLGELRGLRWEDINWEKGYITVKRSIYKKDHITTTKSNAERIIPLPESLKDVLWLHKKKTGYVFQYKPDTNIRNDICRNELHRICQKADLRKIGWHALRHSFASHMAEQNISPLHIKELLGHADLQTTMKYTHLNRMALRLTINTMDEVFGHNMATVKEKEQETTSLIPVQNTHLLPKNNKKQSTNSVLCGCGTDGTRTRDLLRDRQAF